jgi:ParB family chromosome partitioning protein
VSSPRRIGLPDARRMRHDLHFVEQLVRPNGLPIGRAIPIEDIDPNPHQPRHDVGDISELTASIREKGLLEPILVRPVGSRFQIIAGERRFRAASEVGLAELPCVVRDVGDAEAMEMALVENLQRKDLDPFEEADGMHALADSYQYTHEELAERIGKSRTSITETLSIASMPTDVRELCRLADISSKSLLLQIVRQSSPAEMTALIRKLQESGATRAVARDVVRKAKGGKPARARPFVFRYRPKEKTFSLTLQFRRSEVSRDEILAALQRIMKELREGSQPADESEASEDHS